MKQQAGDSQPGYPDGTQRERVPVLIFDESEQLSLQVARRIANLIEERNAVGDSLVLGLPTGSTPIGVYEHLVRMHREDGLDFSRVVTFNLDEYYPMSPESLQSYHRFMRENLFDHVNIPAENIHIPSGEVPREDVEAWCQRYEFEIQKAGGIDLMLLGIGRSGHIGFNEPGSGLQTRTRAIVLDEITRKDAASDFFGDDNVPREAITMGVGTILDAREVILIATGEHKAPIVCRAVEEEPTKEVTAGFLQLHRDATFYLDRAAASELTREKTPWQVRAVEWDEALAKRAVIWLSEKVGRAILRLEESDFHRQHLHSLVSVWPDTDALCRKVFEDLRRRVAYEEELPRDQKVIVFSPHPDDDVISMGGMLDKLVQNGNQVTVAYMTNGSVAVFDADVRRYLHFLEMSLPELDGHALEEAVSDLRNSLANKEPGQIDSPRVQRAKAFIRYAEAVSAIEVMGLGREQARFLDMPFYQTGMVRKNPIGEEDVRIVRELMDELSPDHIFVAGDLSDPHGTHRMCYKAIAKAVTSYHSDHGLELQPTVWLYRGAWQEWEIDRADVFVPLSKADLARKIEAIFKHESQKDRAMFPGAYDAREFWERARDRNVRTAEALNALGLPEFYAVEAYVTVAELP
ncbi:MAG: glucosamine-6-phosphate deaminase [Rhodothermales bacterium]|nr:glucosamine-6-phosphate deaminase [Rhodothermales bacterium]